MSKYVFLYRVKDSDDRDKCAYLDTTDASFICGHYFGGIGICGANYRGGKFKAYKDIETILTAAEYNRLLNIQNDIGALGYGIEKGSDRYKEGMRLRAEYNTILEKLETEEAKDFFSEIIKEEKAEAAEEYDIDEDEIDEIFENYPGDYQDKSIICYVYEDAEELGRNFYENCYGQINETLDYYFDFEKFGQNMADEDEYYYELTDGRIVYYSMRGMEK